MPFDPQVDPRAGPSPAGPISIYRGSYASLPAAMLKPPTEGNRTIPVPISWLRDGQSPSYAVLFNARLQQVLNFTQICSLHVDNTRCSTNINIVFPDTGFQVQLKANSEGFYPILTNGLEFVAFCELQPAAGDTTTIQVMNFLPPPIEFGGFAGGGAGVGTVRQIDTVAPLQGGPITDTGTISISTPISLNFGGTAANNRNTALDNLGGTGGAAAGVLTRATGGTWSLSAAGVGTLTGVTAGTGLTGGGTSGTVNVALLTPVNVTLGGTGATDAAGARTNLGAAPIASPAFSGNASLITPPPLNDNSHSIVSSDWVKSQGFSTTAALVSTQNNVGRNLTLNSLFSIWQRGNGPFTGSPSGIGPDRWGIYTQAPDTVSVSAYTMTDADRTEIGDEAARTAMQAVVVGNTGGYTTVGQRMEDVRRFANKSVTISFWAKVNTGPRNLGLNLTQQFGSGGSPSGSVTSATPIVVLTTVWSRFSATIALPSIAGKTLGTANNSYCELAFYPSIGGGNPVDVQSGTFYLWGVQLEFGVDTTPLEKPDPQQDLAKCQRFYQVGYHSESLYGVPGWGYGRTLPFPVQMRATPTMVAGAPSLTNASNVTLSAPNFAFYNPGFQVAVTGNATVGYTWTASADL